MVRLQMVHQALMGVEVGGLEMGFGWGARMLSSVMQDSMEIPIHKVKLPKTQPWFISNVKSVLCKIRKRYSALGHRVKRWHSQS
jgi:hypothetical protein